MTFFCVGVGYKGGKIYWLDGVLPQSHSYLVMLTCCRIRNMQLHDAIERILTDLDALGCVQQQLMGNSAIVLLALKPERMSKWVGRQSQLSTRLTPLRPASHGNDRCAASPVSSLMQDSK
jgi:hypothetical protein